MIPDALSPRLSIHDAALILARPARPPSGSATPPTAHRIPARERSAARERRARAGRRDHRYPRPAARARGRPRDDPRGRRTPWGLLRRPGERDPRRGAGPAPVPRRREDRLPPLRAARRSTLRPGLARPRGTPGPALPRRRNRAPEPRPPPADARSRGGPAPAGAGRRGDARLRDLPAGGRGQRSGLRRRDRRRDERHANAVRRQLATDRGPLLPPQARRPERLPPFLPRSVALRCRANGARLPGGVAPPPIDRRRPDDLPPSAAARRGAGVGGPGRPRRGSAPDPAHPPPERKGIRRRRGRAPGDAPAHAEPPSPGARDERAPARRGDPLRGRAPARRGDPHAARGDLGGARLRGRERLHARLPALDGNDADPLADGSGPAEAWRKLSSRSGSARLESRRPRPAGASPGRS